REGKVRHVGLSEVGVKEIERARRVVDIVSVQNRYNALDREWEDVVDYCEREGMAFIPWAPLDSGRMTSPAQTKRAEHGLRHVARRHEATPSQIALAWLLARSRAILVIPGTSKVAHLEENVA